MSAIDIGELEKAVGQSERPAVDDAADLRGEILRIVTLPKEPERSKRELVADAVLSALRTRGKLYFHAERRDFDSAMFFDTERARLVRVRADEFRAFLSEWTALNRSDRYFDAAFAAVETAALSDALSTPVLPCAYWHARPGAIYLSNGDGRTAKITAQSVELVDNGTDGVLFAAGRTLAPWKLATPRDPFETCALFRDVRCSASHGPDLIRVALYSLPTDPRCKPPHCLTGPVGSGKTRTGKGFCELYGIPFVASKVEDDREGDFWPNIDGGGLFLLDNADTRCKWLPDALAAAATDGCSQRRKLYCNSETITLRPRAWIIVTSASPTFAADAGLADRMIPIRMDHRDGDTSDAALADEIAQHRDAGLSFVAQTLRAALADTAPTAGGLNARHPDFASFAVRIGRAIGREAQFVAALAAAEQDKSAFCLENDFLGAAIVAFLADSEKFTGTAKELLEKLQTADPDLADVSAKRLGKRISALWPHLEKAFGASKVRDRKGFTLFTFDPERRVCRVSNGFSHKVPHESDSREFIGKRETNSANSANYPEHTGQLV